MASHRIHDLVLVAAGAALAVSLAPARASAQCTCPATSSPALTDGGAFLWDICGDGNVMNGSIDAYDEGMMLRINGVYFGGGTPTTELSGRQIVHGPRALGSLMVTRKIYVPTTERWARWVDIINNPTAAGVTAAVRIETNCGSDSSTVVTGSQSGDTVFTVADRWVTTDDFDASGDPSLNHNLFGPGAPIPPTSVGMTVFSCSGTEGPFQEYTLTIAAGQTVALMYFGGQNNNQADSMTNARAIDAMPDTILYGLTTELTQIVNWSVLRRSCAEIRASMPTATDGIYEIDPDGRGGAAPVNVYCGMTTGGGGWTLVGSTRDVTLNDEASAYYADLTTLTPAAGHTGIWSGLRTVLGGRADIRFSCRNAAYTGPFTVDLAFYDVDWYDEISVGPDALVCFEEGDGAGATMPPPARRDLLAGTGRGYGDLYDCMGYLEGENSCGDTGSFTVDLDDRGMDCDENDGTDWGEDDGLAKCGTRTSSGTWFVWVRPASPVVCGDGWVGTGEVCDDGNTVDCDGCRGDCSAVETGCGDGFQCGAEVCDDGNTVSCDGCRNDCLALDSGCGDGALCGAEACDDGNNVDCDGCRADCSAVETGCGDGFTCGAEACDDGNNVDCDGCRADCSAVETGCGDGFTCDPELCDDGNTDEHDACLSACVPAFCGDGFIHAGVEECDDGDAASGDGCSSSCLPEHGFACTGEPSVCASTCGDGVLAADEACDDGNLANGDGCTLACRIETGWSCTGEPSVCNAGCGDGLVASTEPCDDGNLSDGDGCSATCTVEHGFTCAGTPSVCASACGDGLVASTEACDDGNTTDGDGCSATCTVEAGYSCPGEPSACITVCGDGILSAAEECDDGNTTPNDGCSSGCRVDAGYTCTGEPSVCVSTCGDGRIAGDETCDDGNAVAGDGCDATCEPEHGFQCTGRPSVCSSLCGDGVVASDEQCDDRNTVGGDGCSAACALEPGWHCDPSEPSVCSTGGGDAGGDAGPAPPASPSSCGCRATGEGGPGGLWLLGLLAVGLVRAAVRRRRTPARGS
jgi:MYXO-CTERM domain-containing protein